MIGLSGAVIDQADTQNRQQAEIDTRSSIQVEFALQWQSQDARHIDCRYFPALDLWQDFFPPALEAQLVGHRAGESTVTSFAVGELVGEYEERACISVPAKAFRSSFGNRTGISPHVGRFYPRGIIAGVQGIQPEDLTPLRVIDTGDTLTVDLNHPLAGCPLTLTGSVYAVGTAAIRGGACKDVGELICNGGPGMQARLEGRATDFRSGNPFRRADESADAKFYQQPRLLNHVDTTAVTIIENLYASLLPESGEVLDLMAAWRSHMPDRTSLKVTGLGMNQAELDANPRLNETCVQDLNADPSLPFATGCFAAVVCTASIEYLTRPAEVLAEIHRTLEPGGRFIVTYSNRWFPPKAIEIWSNCHEFERLGLVLDYFLQDGRFSDLSSWSLRGLPRPPGDRYAGRLPWSDPVYAVWGSKTAP